MMILYCFLHSQILTIATICQLMLNLQSLELPLPINGHAICEAQLLRRILQLPKICNTTLIFGTGDNVQELNPNTWLIITIAHVAITIKCSQSEVVLK